MHRDTLTFTFTLQSRVSSVGIVPVLRAGRLGLYSSIPGGCWEFFSSPPYLERLWGPPSLLSNVCGGPRCEADHSPPSSFRVSWSYTSTPQYAFMAWCSVKSPGTPFTLVYFTLQSHDSSVGIATVLRAGRLGF
jgi:hypothetical protein